MATVYMSCACLKQTEIETHKAFAESYPTLDGLLAQSLDVMFRLPYFIRSPSPIPPDGVHGFSVERIHRVPYTLRAAWLLTRPGTMQKPSCSFDTCWRRSSNFGILLSIETYL